MHFVVYPNTPVVGMRSLCYWSMKPILEIPRKKNMRWSN